MSELSEAVDALTKPSVDHFPQTDDDGKWLRTHTVEHPPLLQQLNDAITSATGRGGGGGNSAGDVLNGEALYRAYLIRPEIESWCRSVGGKVTKDMVVDLRRWHDLFKDGDTSGYYARQTAKWVDKINELLDPPKRFEITAPCPMCGADKWTDAKGDVLPFPVVVEYRRETPSSANSLCRACEVVCTGIPALRGLRWEIDEKEIA